MSDVLSKRIQQAAFELAASSNRGAGSGGGSGYQPVQLLGSGFNASGALTINTLAFTVITGSSITYVLPHTSNVEVRAIATGKYAAGGGAFAYGALFMDGTIIDNTKYPLALWDIGTGYKSCTLVDFLPAQAVGSHTVDFRVQVDNVASTWTNYQVATYALQLSF